MRNLLEITKIKLEKTRMEFNYIWWTLKFVNFLVIIYDL